MIEIKCYGKIEEGAFVPRNPLVYQQQLMDAGNVSDCLLTIEGSNRRTVDQNAYAHAICNQIATRVNQDGWNFTGYQVYKKIENDKCGIEVMNQKTGQVVETIKPLKEMDRNRFWEIIEEARIEYMQRLDIYIDTPAEHYGITEEAYDLMKAGAITYFDAKKMSVRNTPSAV